MGKPNWKRKHQQRGSRPQPGEKPQPQPPRPQTLAQLQAGRYDAPRDEPIAIDARLTLQEPFQFPPTLIDRLRRRDVNVKEAFTLRDGSGDYFRASLRELGPAGGMALPYEKMSRSPEPNVEITLACAVLGRQRMIFVVQKATELGVTNIVPLITDHSVQADGLEHERANAWPAQVVRAAKQCRRGSLPAVLPPTTLEGFMQSPTFQQADVRVMLDDRSEHGAAPPVPPKRIVLLIGPEGGFSDAERTRLAGHVTPWFLGGRILRAETAVLVGLTAVQMTWGDFAV